MHTRKTRPLPVPLAAAQRRFEQWRRTRTIGERIPEVLWDTAVKLADAYGVHATSKALGVGYYSLKKRLEHTSASPSNIVAPAIGTTFVELRAPMPTAIPECVVELQDAEGASLRIELKGIQASDLAALGRSLWRAD